MNISLSSALECATVLLLFASGCGPNDGVKEFEKGKEAYAVRNLVKADKLFSASLERSPTDVDRLVYLARVKLDLGDLTTAKDLVTKALLNADGDSDVRMLAAQIAWHARDYQAAAEGFERLANDEKLPGAVRAQAWVGLGVVEMTRESHHFARVDFLRAIRIDRKNVAARYHLGVVYRGFAYLDAALEQFEAYVHLQKEKEANPRVQKVQRVVIPQLKESIAQAMTEQPGAANRNSAICASVLSRAEAEAKKGSYRNARLYYQQALTADPLSYPAALGLAKAWEKTDSTKEGQQKAFEKYKLACKLRPSAVSTFLTAGSLAVRQGLTAQAVEIYSRAVAASPTSLDALDGLIRALRKSKKDSIAKAYQAYRDSLTAKK